MQVAIIGKLRYLFRTGDLKQSSKQGFSKHRDQQYKDSTLICLLLCFCFRFNAREAAAFSDADYVSEFHVHVCPCDVKQTKVMLYTANCYFDYMKAFFSKNNF